MIRPLAEIEREAILAAIEETGGSVLKAAPLLGMGKTTLYRRVRSYGGAGACRETEKVWKQASALASIPLPKPVAGSREPVEPAIALLYRPSTRLEMQQANLRCPNCRITLLLREKGAA